MADGERMSSGALGASPFEWIVNSNALGVGFLSKESGFRVSFLSRHAVGRLADGTLLGRNADQLIDAPAQHLADVPELSLASLADPDNYPTVAKAEYGGKYLELAISSVIDGDGVYLGAMVTFKDTTDLVQRQHAAAEFKDTMSTEATKGRTQADETEQVASGLSSAVETLQSHGAEIATLTQQLTTLNNQTRMLSLNASIESVRAGEAGRAFRVIADEVGELALRTQGVTQEVEGILNTIDVDSKHAYDYASKVVENVGSLIASQRAMDEAVRDNH